jgi:hypothetical protein
MKEQGKFRLTLRALVATVLILLAAIGLRLTWNLATAQLPAARNGTDRVGDFALLDQEGKQHQLYRYVDSRAVVLFVYGSDCSIARKSIPALKELREQFSSAGQDDGFRQLWKRVANQGDGFLMRVGRRLPASAMVS